MDGEILETHDLYFAAYMMMRQDAEYVGRERRGRRVFFQFRGQKTPSDYRNDFYSSPFADYAAKCKACKELVFSDES